MFRRQPDMLEVFLVHPGGPFWKGRDEGAWTIPKGECQAGEHPLDAARREFTEETGFTASPPFLELGAIRQSASKIVHAWAFEGDCNPADLVSNSCEIVWPPKSGQRLEIPEVDRGEWFGVAEAKKRVLAGQAVLLELLVQRVGREE